LERLSIPTRGSSLFRPAGRLETVDLEARRGGAEDLEGRLEGLLSPRKQGVGRGKSHGERGLRQVDGLQVDIIEVTGHNSGLVAYIALFPRGVSGEGGESPPLCSILTGFASARGRRRGDRGSLEGAGAASLGGGPEGQAGLPGRFLNSKTTPRTASLGAWERIRRGEVRSAGRSRNRTSAGSWPRGFNLPAGAGGRERS
jgi:hypothetical protein